MNFAKRCAPLSHRRRVCDMCDKAIETYIKKLVSIEVEVVYVTVQL